MRRALSAVIEAANCVVWVAVLVVLAAIIAGLSFALVWLAYVSGTAMAGPTFGAFLAAYVILAAILTALTLSQARATVPTVPSDRDESVPVKPRDTQGD